MTNFSVWGRECPRCGQTVAAWQPIHIKCFAYRIRYLLVPLILAFLIPLGYRGYLLSWEAMSNWRARIAADEEASRASENQRKGAEIERLRPAASPNSGADISPAQIAKGFESEEFPSSKRAQKSSQVIDRLPLRPTTEANVENKAPLQYSNTAQLIMQLLDYATKDDGTNHETEIQDIKQKIDALPKPAKGQKKSARAVNEQALSRFNSGELEEAVKLFKDASQLDKSDPEILNNLGYALLKQGNIEAAEGAILETLAISPGRSNAWQNLGDILGAKNDMPRAIAAYENVYRFSKNRAKTYLFMQKLNVNDVSTLKKARQKAMDWAEQMFADENLQKITQAPNSNTAQLIMQLLDYATKDDGTNHETEIQDIKQKIDALPKPAKGQKKSARAVNEQALSRFNSGELEEAVKLFKDASQLDKSDPEILNNLGYALLKQGNIEAAEGAILETLAISPGRSNAWQNLGDILGAKNDMPRAIAAYENVYRFSKNRAKTYLFMQKLNVNDVSTLKKARQKAMDWAEQMFADENLQQITHAPNSVLEPTTNGSDDAIKKIDTKSNDALFGNWRGSVSQPGYGSYITLMSFHDTNGTVEYPSLKCGGTVKMLSKSGNEYRFLEHITYGRCIDSGVITVKVRGDSMDWKWQGLGITSTAILAR